MIDRNKLADKLGVEKLEDYIIAEFTKGKEDANKEFDKYLISSSDKIKEIEKEDFRVAFVLIELTTAKSDLCKLNNNYIFQMLQESKDYYSNTLPFKSIEKNELDRLATYILDYYDFKNTPDFLVEGQLIKIKENSIVYHIVTNYISNSKKYFDILNEIYKIDNYTWSWNNFDQGIIKLLARSAHDKLSYKSDCESEIEIFQINKRFELDSLETKIKYLNNDLKSLKKEIELKEELHNKYYYNSQIILNITYFGDNMPFLFNLYNFLKSNNLLQYGWSYFYSCMNIGNNEMIPLDKPKKLNFIGRIFYHLIDYLVLHYKENPFQFIKSKFLIGEVHVTDSFKNNHMKPNYNKNDDPELVTVDDFFEKQKKIYLKI